MRVGSDGEGGALFVSDSELEIRGSHFEHLRAEVNGGAFALVDGARAYLTASTLTHCSAGTIGGGAFISNGSTCVMDQMLWSFNEAGEGGAVLQQGSHMNVSASVFKNNTANIGLGGGVASFTGSSVRITRGICVFTSR